MFMYMSNKSMQEDRLTAMRDSLLCPSVYAIISSNSIGTNALACGIATGAGEGRG